MLYEKKCVFLFKGDLLPEHRGEEIKNINIHMFIKKLKNSGDKGNLLNLSDVNLWIFDKTDRLFIIETLEDMLDKNEKDRVKLLCLRD